MKINKDRFNNLSDEAQIDLIEKILSSQNIDPEARENLALLRGEAITMVTQVEECAEVAIQFYFVGMGDLDIVHHFKACFFTANDGLKIKLENVRFLMANTTPKFNNSLTKDITALLDSIPNRRNILAHYFSYNNNTSKENVTLYHLGKSDNKLTHKKPEYNYSDALNSILQDCHVLRQVIMQFIRHTVFKTDEVLDLAPINEIKKSPTQ